MNPTDMMNQTYGWMSGRMGLWAIFGVLLVVLLVVLFLKVTKK